MNTMNTLNSITNENGGGMSYEATGKYTSVRHERAMRSEDKMTAGDAAKALRKSGTRITARELVSTYAELFGWHGIEWHHSGFVPGKNKMGKTYFFTQGQLDRFVSKLPELETVRKAAEEAKREVVQGFAYAWDSDYSGRYGKKRNFKRLVTYTGEAKGSPKGFVKLTEDQYLRAVKQEGKAYYGYDEPMEFEFNHD